MAIHLLWNPAVLFINGVSTSFMNNPATHYVSLIKTLLLALLITGCSNHHNSSYLSATWIGDSLEAMWIGDVADTSARQHQLSNAQGMTLSVSLRTDSTLLEFRTPVSVLKKHAPAGSFKQYTLAISQQTDRSLTLIPVSDEACAFFGNKHRLVFRKQSLVIDSEIRFEKIIFHTTECFGTCSVFHLEIDSASRFRQHTEVRYRQANCYSTREGYFTGTMPNNTYQKLMTAIRTSHLRQLTSDSDDMLCCDAPIGTIILYANGQRTSFRSMFPPIVVQNLVNVLYQIAREQAGTRTSTPFVLEGWNGKPSTDLGNVVDQ
ncbi:DUF6438 domain-containing protein [Spirosoma sp. KUDC1026]|uniref:DUF6438 domain-containing protein n=1 Tax=Spirosoma sp. KUDC1026 TaxID=2745947 RepID=UPI00159BB9AF|nr:DUF6438 domain-containing protein [Spirosoma sp. KUDC1026]QKZ14014.1 hypothetical protein HU175_15815 [Spirosoma sp. KUDC1026]